MNRIEFFVTAKSADVEPAAWPLELASPLHPISCATDAVACLGLALERAAQYSRYAIIETPGRRAYASHDMGGSYQPTDAIASPRGPSYPLSATELIDIAGLV